MATRIKDISALFEYYSGQIKKGKISFADAAKEIGSHAKLTLDSLTDVLAVYTLKTPVLETKIIFESDKSLKYHPELVLQMVSRVSKVPVESMRTKSRKRELVEARHAYFLVMLDLVETHDLSYSLWEIGKPVNRDHCTVLHARKNAHLQSIQEIYKNAKRLI